MPHAYYHADGNGNVTCLIGPNGQVLARYLYDPFGNELAAVGPLRKLNLYGFSSKELHPPSGLVYYGYRFYDPSLQRWMNRDPILERGGRNIFCFAGNSPANRRDSFGLKAEPPRTPAGHCHDPCGDAQKQGLDQGHLGGVICCQGQKYTCVWGLEREGSSPTALFVIALCVHEHEADHLDDIDCPRIWCWGFPTRPDFKAGKDPDAEECSANTVEYDCLSSNISLCGGDPTCENEVGRRMDFVAGEISRRCRGR